MESKRNWVIEIWIRNREVVIGICGHVLKYGLVLLVLYEFHLFIEKTNWPQVWKDLFNALDLYTGLVLAIIFASELIVRVLQLSLRKE